MFHKNVNKIPCLYPTLYCPQLSPFIKCRWKKIQPLRRNIKHSEWIEKAMLLQSSGQKWNYINLKLAFIFELRDDATPLTNTNVYMTKTISMHSKCYWVQMYSILSFPFCFKRNINNINNGQKTQSIPAIPL